MFEDVWHLEERVWGELSEVMADDSLFSFLCDHTTTLKGKRETTFSYRKDQVIVISDGDGNVCLGGSFCCGMCQAVGFCMG